MVAHGRVYELREVFRVEGRRGRGCSGGSWRVERTG